MVAPFQDLLRGLNWITGYSETGGLISPDLWQQLQNISPIRKNQRSGYGYAIKIFQVGATSICSITGYFRNSYVVQTWSEKYRMGHIGIFHGFTEAVKKELDAHDIFFNQIYKMEVNNGYKEKFARRHIKMTGCYPNEIDGMYVSLSNKVFYFQKTGGTVYLSYNKVEWKELEWVDKSRLLLDHDELIIDDFHGKVCGIYYNASCHFDYFFYNSSIDFIAQSGKDIIERTYAISLSSVFTGTDKPRLTNAVAFYAPDKACHGFIIIYIKGMKFGRVEVGNGKFHNAFAISLNIGTPENIIIIGEGVVADSLILRHLQAPPP